PAHRVRDVAVPRREEAEAVLSREVAPTALPGAPEELALGLAAELVPGLVHMNLDRIAVLGELVRRREPTDATSEDRHLDSSTHLYTSSPPSAPDRRLLAIRVPGTE